MTSTDYSDIFPFKSISACLRISIIPSGVHGINVLSPVYNLPIFIGLNPSTSLSGLIASNTFASETCFGSGT